MVEIDLHESSIVAFSLVSNEFVMTNGRRELLDPDRRLVSVPAVADDIPPTWMLEGNRPPSVQAVVRSFRRLFLHTIINWLVSTKSFAARIAAPIGRARWDATAGYSRSSSTAAIYWSAVRRAVSKKAGRVCVDYLGGSNGGEWTFAGT